MKGSMDLSRLKNDCRQVSFHLIQRILMAGPFVSSLIYLYIQVQCSVVFHTQRIQTYRYPSRVPLIEDTNIYRYLSIVPHIEDTSKKIPQQCSTHRRYTYIDIPVVFNSYTGYKCTDIPSSVPLIEYKYIDTQQCSTTHREYKYKEFHSKRI